MSRKARHRAASAAKRLRAVSLLLPVLAGALSTTGPGHAGAQDLVPLARERGGAAALDGDYLDFLLGPTTAAPASRTPATWREAEAPTRRRVRLATAEPAGSILIDSAAKRLYLVEPGGFAQSYLVGVGREGFGWHGMERVSAKREWPDWRPPAEMLARRPDLPRHMPGGPDNPLGAGALYLGATLYRIHGSNEPDTVGSNASSGCFRMRNADLVDLYGRVEVGARVTVF